MMAFFVILGLLVYIKGPGSRAVTPVFVQSGNDLVLDVMTAVPKEFNFFMWKFNENYVLVSLSPGGKPNIYENYTGRVKLSVNNFSVTLKNLQKTDSGVYTARVIRAQKQIVAEYTVTVQDPVSPVTLTVDSVSSSSDSCNLTVTCSTQDSHISTTFRCVNQICSEDGGERSKATTSGAVLHVYTVNDLINCNHSNQASWTKNKGPSKIQDFCPQRDDSAGFSICLVKMVVFSVGLIIMVSVVIGVHLMERSKKKK